MSTILFNGQFLLISATNLCLFLVVATWSFLPVVIVEMGGNSIDVGLVIGSIGVTSLGSLPLLAPLIDRYGRKTFIVGGILLMGITNAGFLLFKVYSPLMIIVRVIQGIAFAACFNGCATAVVDLIPPEHRAQGIGFFGVSGSLAVAIGPYIGEVFLTRWGNTAYFLLLVGFGLLGFLMALMVKESNRNIDREQLQGFFPTAFHDGHLPMMIMAAIFGSGFAAMNTFIPLFAKNLGLKAGLFFISYGCSLIIVRMALGQLADRINRDKLIFACLIGFGVMLVSTSRMDSMIQMVFLGGLFGVLQGLSYPAMMARMVDRADDNNLGVVVALFTGSFGVGLNISVLGWGVIADANGISSMFLIGGLIMFACAAVAAWPLVAGKETSLPRPIVVESKSDERPLR
ncbi:MAG: MFS transporter [Desulfomonilaceae bacterium]